MALHRVKFPEYKVGEKLVVCEISAHAYDKGDRVIVVDTFSNGCEFYVERYLHANGTEDFLHMGQYCYDKVLARVVEINIDKESNV